MMQEPWKKAREEYQNQPIPPQLEARVKQAIGEGRQSSPRQHWLKKGLIHPHDAWLSRLCADGGQSARDR